MNEQQFKQLLVRAFRNEAPAEILAAVELEPGLVTRASEEDGETILHNACFGGHIDLARDLVDRQADRHQRCTKWGQDALMYASANGHIPVIEFLLSRGADMTARTNNGITALGVAALFDKVPACKFLISRGSDLMSKINDGRTALDFYGTASTINPPLSTEVKKQRCNELLAAFHEAKDQKNAAQAKENAALAATIAILKRPAESMLFSEDFSDLVFVVGGERIPAHRIILAANSEHMGALLKGPWRENVDGQAVEVPMEQSASAVRVLLRFVYTGEVDEAGLSSQPVLLGVLDLSSRHLLPELKAACERRLVGSLSMQSLADALVAAHLHDLAALKTACVEFIKANLAAVMLLSSLIKLKKAHPAIWKQLRVALGESEEDEDDEDDEEEEEDEQQQAKRARRDV
jgi:BTB/POZ domain/Ankyrin repeats (3 copies)